MCGELFDPKDVPASLLDCFEEVETSCGAPWVRVTEKQTVAKDRPTGKGWQAGIEGQDNWASGTPTHSGLSAATYQRVETTGWTPSCQCAPVSCPDCGHTASDHQPRFGCTDDGEWDGYGWTGCGCNRESLIPAPVPCVVLDPFLGSGTTLMVASRLGRDGVGIELNETYAKMAEQRIRQDAGSLFPETVETTEMPEQQDLFSDDRQQQARDQGAVGRAS